MILKRDNSRLKLALIKKNRSEAKKSELSDNNSFIEPINRLVHELDNISFKLNQYLKTSNDTVVEVSTGTEETLRMLNKTIVETKDQLRIIPDTLSNVDKILSKVANIPFPKIPEVKFPEVQKVIGQVKVENQINLSGLSSKLDKVTQAIQSLRGRLQQKIEVDFPKIEFPKQEIQKSISLNEAKEIIDTLREVKESINKINIPKVNFPSTINVGNFPPQKYPMPVTHMSINSLRGFVKTTAITVSSSLTPLPSEVLTSRRSIIVYNNSSQILEVGGSTFTFGNGLPIPANSYSPPLDAGPEMIIYGRVASSTADIRVMEVSDELSGR